MDLAFRRYATVATSPQVLAFPMPAFAVIAFPHRHRGVTAEPPRPAPAAALEFIVYSIKPKGVL
jgi:hypothetical protein